MDKKHYSFPSIDQYREVVKTAKYHAEYVGKDEEGNPIYDESIPKPIVKFTGTVKLHGTNASIVFLKDGSVQFQSRERVLEYGSDNSGFYATYAPHEESLKLMMSLIQYPSYKEYMAVYGEWCGSGINRGCGIHQLPKKFVVFGVKIDDMWYHPTVFPVNLELDIYNVYNFDTFTKTIDFNKPEEALDELNRVTLEVENECPVAKAFGVSGIGEGIVWIGKHVQEDGTELTYRFKTKGEKHSLKASKEPKAVSLDIEAFNSVNEFLDSNLSSNRLEQGIAVLKEQGLSLDIKNIGTFIKWCVNDLKKECLAELLANKISDKILNKEASKRAKDYFIKELDKQIGL